MPAARTLLAGASEELARAGVASPRVDAELLLAHVTGRPRLTLGLIGDIPQDQAAAFEALVARRAAREPLQHLTGSAPFRRLELAVGPGVFVPRPETELLVDEVLAHLARSRVAGHTDRPSAESPTPGVPSPAPTSALATDLPSAGPVLVDLCTGSAAIALSMAVEVPGARVHAVELSQPALAWATRNVESCAPAVRAAGSELRLLAADATTVADPGGGLAHLVGMVDVVVTNPPYVPDAALPREPEVRDHDPHLALFGGPDGLDVIRPLARQAALLLRPGGLLLVEHADVQGEEAGPLGVPALLREQPEPDVGATGPTGSGPARPDPLTSGPTLPAWRDVTDHADLNGLPRYTRAVRAGQDQPR